MASVEKAAAALEAARAAFLDADALDGATNQEIIDLLELTAALTRVLDAQRVRLAGAIADRSGASDENAIHRLLGSRHAREAVSRAFGLRSRDAAELLTMAAATTRARSLTGETIAVQFPRVAKALDHGELSLAQARAIVSTLSPAAPRADLEQLAWAEGCLVDEATLPDRRLPPELLVTQAQAYVAVLDPDGVLPNSERQRAMRSLRMRKLSDGMWELVLRCTPETAAAIKAVLDASTAPRVSVRFRDVPLGDDDSDDGPADAEARDQTRNADIHHSAEAEGAAARAAIADDRTPEQKRHDVMVAIVEAFAAGGGAPVAGGEVPRLVLTGTIEAFSAYLQGIDHPDRALIVEHTGDRVPIETVDRMLCNAVVQRAVVDAKGCVLDLGRTQRTFNRAQRRALAAQYGGCATPGCDFPVAWTEAHHVWWWEHGGPTDVANGILLCSHCHHEVHGGRLRVVGKPGAWRVVPQLRPADRYRRNARTGIPLVPIRTGATVAAAAAPALAVKLPDTTPAATARTATQAGRTATQMAPSATQVARSATRVARSATQMPARRPRHRSRPVAAGVPRRSAVEARLRRRSTDGDRRQIGMLRADFRRPTHRVVLRN